MEANVEALAHEDYSDDVSECPACLGRGMIAGDTGPTGDDPEKPCALCAGVGQVPIGYAHAYREVLRENDGLDATVWALQRDLAAAMRREQGLRRELQRAGAKLRGCAAPPANLPRGRRPVTNG